MTPPELVPFSLSFTQSAAFVSFLWTSSVVLELFKPLPFFSSSSPSCADRVHGASSFCVTFNLSSTPSDWEFLRVTVARGSFLLPDSPVRLRIRGLCEEPRALATAASFPCRLSLWSRLPAAPPAGDEVKLNQEREAISFRLLCCLSSYAEWKDNK